MSLNREVRINFRRIVSHIALFALGIFSYWLLKGWQAEIPRSANHITEPIPVNISRVIENDSWIYGFELQVVPLYTIDSTREYVMLIIHKKENIEPQLPNKSARFTIKGLTDQDTELWFSINPSELNNQSSATKTLLLDFGGSLFRRKRIRFSEKLELFSMGLNRE